jgi:Rrf2 family nitric oxide-sensitive transcriptional repressor
MAGLLNLGDMTSLALHALVRLTHRRDADPQARSSVAELAEGLFASKHTLHKVATRLATAGFVETGRGPGGGIRLTADPSDLTLLRVVEAMEGPVPTDGCLFANRVCGPDAPCAFSCLTRGLEQHIREYFTKNTIRSLADSTPCALHELEAKPH